AAISAIQTSASNDTTNHPPPERYIRARADQAARTAGTLNSDQPMPAAGLSARPRTTAGTTANSQMAATAGTSQRTMAAPHAVPAGWPDNHVHATHSMRAIIARTTPATRQRTVSAPHAVPAGWTDNHVHDSHSMRASIAAATPIQSVRDGGCGNVRRSHSQHAHAAAMASRAMNHPGLPAANAAASTASNTTAVTTRWPSMRFSGSLCAVVAQLLAGAPEAAFAIAVPLKRGIEF